MCARPHRLGDQDATLSRWKQGFEPPWGHQRLQGFLATLVHFASLSGAKLGPFRGQTPDQASRNSPQDPVVHKGRGSTRGMAAGLSGALMCGYKSTRSHLFYRFSPEIRTDFGRFEERLSRGAVWARSKSSLDTICGDALSISTVELSGQLPEDPRPQFVPRLRRRTRVLVDLECYRAARQLPRPCLLRFRLFRSSSVPASGVTEVDVGDHRAILHTGISHVKEDYGGQGERELVGVAAQAGGRG